MLQRLVESRLGAALQNWRRPRFVRERAERGQGLVEFALAVPVLLIVICGILEFSFIFTDQIMLNNAARDGARAGAIPAGVDWPTRSSQATSAATNSSSSLISCPQAGPPTYTVRPTYGNPNNSAVATQVTVAISCRYKLITPLGALVSAIGSTNITLSVSATKMVEP